jgi:hypothetical protein
MNALIITLRLFHILAAMFWFGGTIFMVRFVLPTARRVGPAGGPFMQSFMSESGVVIALTVAGWVAILAGVILMVLVSGRFDPSWTRSPMGITFSLGGLLGILAGLHGIFVQSVNARRMGALALQISRSGAPPKPEQMAALNALRDKLERGGGVTLLLLAGAAICMAIARYV